MRLAYLCSIALLALNFAEAAKSNNNRKRRIPRTTAETTPQNTEEPVPQNTEEPAPQRRRLSHDTSLPAPLVLSAPLENMYEHALSRVSARNPAESGASINILLQNTFGGINNISIFVRSMLARIIDNNRVISQESDFWDLSPESELSQTKLFGFVVGLASKHQISFETKLSPMLCQVMTGRMEHESLMRVLKETDHFLFHSLNNLNETSEEDLESAAFNFEDFGLPNEPVTRANVDRYIRLKVKMILYHSRAQVFASFLSGVKLVMPISAIREQYTPELIGNVLYTQPDYNAHELRQRFEPIRDYGHYAEQYEWFFTAVDNLSRERRCNLLLFFSGSDRLPTDDQRFNISFEPNSNGGRSRPKGSPCRRHLSLYPVANYGQMVEDLELITHPNVCGRTSY